MTKTWLGVLLLAGCGVDQSAPMQDGASTVPGMNAGVGQGGAQDFGQFRSILEDGGIPGPETIDDVGFFAEHKLELPAAACGDDVCIHGTMGMMGNMITGSDCTVVMMGMNTAIDPSQLERPPLNLAIAVDVSGSMKGDPILYVRSGLEQMLGVLRPEDRVTLVGFSSEADVYIEDVAGDDDGLALAIDGLSAGGGTNIYDGLHRAFEAVYERAEPAFQNRVILLSDGNATVGITSGPHISQMAGSYNAFGISLSTIGVGAEFDVELMQSLAEQGAGAFYFLEDPTAVDEVFVEEVSAFLVPLAEQAIIDVDIDDGWLLRNVYGTQLFTLDGNTASIEIPTLQLAHRETASDQEMGRRGGGGAILLELTPRGPLATTDVGTIDFDYFVPGTDNLVSQSQSIESAVDPQSGEATSGWFMSDSVEKAFVALNLYVGFEIAAESASFGADNEALGVLLALSDNVTIWNATHEDADIEDDLVYVSLFIDNLQARAAEASTVEPQEPWPAD